MSTRKFTIKPNDIIAKCPKCGNNTEFVGHSKQDSEDSCEVWVVCMCGFDPTMGRIGHRLESIMGGIDPDLLAYALDIWSEEIQALPKIPDLENSATIIANKSKQ